MVLSIAATAEFTSWEWAGAAAPARDDGGTTAMRHAWMTTRPRTESKLTLLLLLWLFLRQFDRAGRNGVLLRGVLCQRNDGGRVGGDHLRFRK
jgi:hypothetical protein